MENENTLIAEVEATETILNDETDLELETDVVPEEISEAPELSDELIAAAIGTVENREARDEIYAAAEPSTMDMEITPIVGAVAAAVAVPVKAAKAAKVRAARVVYSKKSEAILAKLGADPSKNFVLQTSDAALSDVDLQTKMESDLAAIDELPKKVQEKVANAFAVIAGKSRLSTYTGYILEALMSTGEITSKGAYDVLIGRGYKEGTARAQANQMFTVFPALRIATRDKNVLRLNSDSTLADALKTAMTSPAASAAT